MDFVYDESGRPLALLYSANGTDFTTYYYTLNLQGDVVKLIGTDGSIAASYTYDAWGNILSSSGTMANINPLRYRGYYYDGETGFYYLQSRYYDPVNRRFLNADSLASTGQGFVGTNTFVYCNNNPVIMHDPNGTCSRFLGFLWKIDCGKATCSSSKNYNPNAKRAAVLYDGRTSGYLGGILGGKGFARQGGGWVTALEAEYDVESYSFNQMNGFVDSWNSLEGEYDLVVILMHGYPGGLSCSGQTLSNYNDSEYTFFDLNHVTINTLNLYSCNGATMSEYYDSAARNFASLTGGNVWAVTNGSINYYPYDYIPYTKDGKWTLTYGMTTITYN